MEHLYIDESGAMTSQYSEYHPYFVIAVVRCSNPEKLKRLHTRFVRRHLNELEASDKDCRMFQAGKFQELKGSALTPELKREFISYFCRKGTMEVFYIILNNNIAYSELYHNTARAFNYILRRGLETFIRNGYLPDDQYIIQLDERNERTETKYFLQNYLNTEFRLENILSHDVAVQYFDSARNRCIQVADVCANFCFSQLHTKAYRDEVKAMVNEECLKDVFWFPRKD